MARQRSNTVQPKPARRLVHKASASTSGDGQLANFPLALSATTSIQTLSSDHRESLRSAGTGERYYTPDEMAPFIYISRDFVDALISELQPSTVSLDAHHQINIVWDELILQLITHAQSINPTHIRTTGINGVFRAEKNESTGTRALAREAMSDAETEYRMFVGECYGKEASKAFQGGQGNGMKDDRDMEVRKALNMLRHKIAGTLTCNSEQDDAQQDIADMKAFQQSGGMTNEMELAMSSVFLATLSEQIMLPIIKHMGEIVGRDSGSTTATASDLYTALSENESVWGFFKRFQCRYALEDAIKPKSKRSIPPRLSGESKTSGRISALAHPNGSDGSGISLVDANMPVHKAGNVSPRKRPGTAYSTGEQGISSYDTPPNGQTLRKSPSMSSNKMKDLPERAASALSMNTRGMIGAWNDQAQAQDAERQTLGSSGSMRSRKEHLDEFDALMKSGETMKVSLTPNRLKTFDANGRHKKLARGLDTDNAADASGTAITPKSGTRKLEARDPRVKREVDEEDASKPFSNLVKRKETWMDLVAEQSEEVLQAEKSEKERLVPPIVLGTAPPRFSPQTPRRKEAMKNNPGLPRFELPDGVEVEKRGASPGPGAAFATLPRSAAGAAAAAYATGKGEPDVLARDLAKPSELGVSLSGKSTATHEPIVLSPVSASTLQARRASGTPLGSPKKKTPAQEMAEFFNSPPPPGFNEPKSTEEPPVSASTVRSAPEKEKRKGLRGFMSRIGGSKKGGDEPPSAYTQGISSNDMFPAGTKRMSGGGISNKGGRYGSRSGSTNTAMSDAELQFNAQYTDANGRFSAKEYALAMEAKKKQSLASLSSFAPTAISVPAPASYRGTGARGGAVLEEPKGLGISNAPPTQLGPPIGGVEGRSASPTKLSQTTRYSTPNLKQAIIQQPLPQPPSAYPSTTAAVTSSNGTTAPSPVLGNVRRSSTISISRKPVPPVDPRQSQSSTPTLPENGAFSNPPTAPGSVDSHAGAGSSTSHGSPSKTLGAGMLGAAFEPVDNAPTASMFGRRKSLSQLNTSSTATSSTEINIIPEDAEELPNASKSAIAEQPSPTPSSASRTRAALDTEQQLVAARTALAQAKAKARRLSSNGGDDQEEAGEAGTPSRSIAPSPVPSPGLLSADVAASPLGATPPVSASAAGSSTAATPTPLRSRSRRDVSPGSVSLKPVRPKTAESKNRSPSRSDSTQAGANEGIDANRPKDLQQQKSMLTSISADGSFRTAFEEPLVSASTARSMGSMREERTDSVPEAAGQVPAGEDESSTGTARAGAVDSVPEAVEADVKQIPHEPEATAEIASVHHSALAPLHDLLRHATSVTECRMLVSAFLLQLGVKPMGEAEQVDPEHKVMAWLLAGGDGPSEAPAGMMSRAFAPAAVGYKEVAGADAIKGDDVERVVEADKAESVSAHTDRTAETDEAGNTSGMTEDAAEPVTPGTVSSRPSTEAVVPVKAA